LREGTSNTAHYATSRGALVSGALVSRPCSWSGTPSIAQHSVRRSHAQAPSGDIQSGAGASLDRERPHWVSPQLPVVLGTDRAKPQRLSTRSLFACDPPLQELRTARAIYRGRRVKDSNSGTYTREYCNSSSPPVSLLGRRARSSFGVARAVFPGCVIWQRDRERLFASPEREERGNCHVTN
jgi:hypothetical protein